MAWSGSGSGSGGGSCSSGISDSGSGKLVVGGTRQHKQPRESSWLSRRNNDKLP